MTELEKVIRGLECHATKGFVACQDCPYYPDELIYEDDDDMEGTICEEKLAADALALLKEQVPKAAWYDSDAQLRFWHCGHCGVCITYGDQYCRICGKAVKWDE